MNSTSSSIIWCFLKLATITFFTSVALSNLGVVEGHTFGMGSCPPILPMKFFELDKFMGCWFAIQKFSCSDKCIVYNFTKGSDAKIRVTQSSRHYMFDAVGIDEYSYTGLLTFPNFKNDAGRMRVKFPLNLAGEADYFMFMTDYVNYGVIFTCQELPIGHRKSMSILSRRPSLDQGIIEQIHRQVKDEGLDPGSFNKIDHSNCGSIGDNTFAIDDKTFAGKEASNETAKTPLRAGSLGSTHKSGSPSIGRGRIGARRG